MIFGAGHIGLRLARLAAETDFSVWVLDDRAEFVTPERFPRADRLTHLEDYEQALSGIELDQDSDLVILTHDHAGDLAVLRQALHQAQTRPVGYLGMIGSRRKWVVIGHDAERIRSVHPYLPVRWITNPRPERGMLSSILTGVADLGREAAAMLLQPVDIPLVRPESLAALLDRWRRQQAPVSYPVFQQRRGHPPLIALAAIPIETHWDLPGGLRTLLRRFDPDRSIEIGVEDPAILEDYDTPADYGVRAGTEFHAGLPEGNPLTLTLLDPN